MNTTNSLLALASEPSFDPNQFVLGLTDAEWQQLNGDQHPLVLRATESAYPTGSIFKVITTEKTALGPQKGIFCTISIDYHSEMITQNLGKGGVLRIDKVAEKKEVAAK